MKYDILRFHLFMLISFATSLSHDQIHTPIATHTDEHAARLTDMGHDTHTTMHGMYGNYPMTREASGTSWAPDSSPLEGFHYMFHEWKLMFEGFSYLVVDDQRGPLGGKKLINENMFMIMAQRNFKHNIIAFRSMFSLEPATVGKCGYPLLLQTGETCDGKTLLINRQHPHDFFMELAIVNTLQFTDNSSAFLYAALPGEPAIGPPVYIMRFSSEYIPETPITHHWVDSTHITFGVITAGYVYNMFKLELSVFNGREPDQHRWGFDKPQLNSYSVRISLNPTQDLALQASYAFLKSPEQLEPEVNIGRSVISAIYNKQWDSNNIQAAAIIGINNDRPGHILPAFLLEATGEFHKKHLFFGRFETVLKDDLFIEPDPYAGEVFNVKKLTLGYIYEFMTSHHIKWGLGGLIDFPMVPQKISHRYGSDTSFMFFLQFRLVQ